MTTSTWQFRSEQHLEDFVWGNLHDLMGLTPLHRQYFADGMVCDILAVDGNRQLSIIELKNVEDRYVIAQLTRYYDAIKESAPFSEQIDYNLPVRLIAIAPQFHRQNFIDRKYTQLEVELFSFSVHEAEDALSLVLEDVDYTQTRRLEIPSPFRATLTRGDVAEVEPLPKSFEPPKSLKKLLEPLSDGQRDYVLNIRDQILSFDDRVFELGKTTSTQYGLQKGSKKELFSTRICAQIIPVYPGEYYPKLVLWLPFPRRKFGNTGRRYFPDKVKGFAWINVAHKLGWDRATNITCYVYLGKTLNAHSKEASLEQYGEIYHSITGIKRTVHSLEDLVMLALEEWRSSIDEKEA